MYQVLYRKWRPNTFEEVSGQPQVTITLMNELKSERINHAYLFTGSRGTGKTTCAKILAKAVNCLDLQDGNPCGKCENCIEFENGRLLSVTEIDAASNTGVDNIRSLIEESAFAPANGKYRVYIIDEVHMLSIGAFNALLKTLEEPPAHVVFILATTEVHKLPATILSRCQRFDFHRIDPNDIAQRLLYIAGEEGISLDKPAAMLIASLADGALRDALSILDRCIAAGTDITVQTVRDAVGLAKSEYLFDLTDYIRDENAAYALSLIDKLYKESMDLGKLCEELCAHIRKLMLIKTMKNPKELVSFSEDEYERAKAQADTITISQVLRYLEVLQASGDKMYRGFNKRLELEMALIKLCTPKADISLQSVLTRLEALEKGIKPVQFAPEENTAKPEKKKRITLMDDDNDDEETDNSVEEHTPEENVKNSATPEPDTVEALSKTSPASAKDAIPSNSVQQNIERTAQATAGQDMDQKQSPLPMPVNTAEQPVRKVDFDELIKNAVPMDNWQQVLDVLEPHAKAIAASFQNTTAYISGQYILIDAKSEMPFKLLRQSAHRDKMRFAIKEVTGKTYKLGPYNKTNTVNQKENLLERLKKDAIENGINVTEATSPEDEEKI